ncbi:MAG: UDP-N-acetylmuramoyl-L-alanyl-D-glutamate--2,6-diaminopimelate ligase, partial [Methylophilaceae bacterium]|nr:UDP-N-acetylmuramoyl-L-alanyl-D-glutamate--2,6-diaminopimelate ligase [Methylophilaceae bacterium]
MSVDLLDILSNCNGITNDSRKVKLGWLFLAYPGRYEDRRKYIPDAIKNGAKYILYEPRNYSVDSKAINFIPVKNLKEKISNIASDYYNHPSKKIEIIGVTGTNGKTTVTGWLDQSFRYLKKPSAWIGTLGFGDGENIKISNNTTPDAILIQEILSDYASKKYSFVTMEVSSHAIEQKRVEGVNFSAKLLTNVSRDHLDYHVTLKDYQDIKKSFFQSNKA